MLRKAWRRRSSRRQLERRTREYRELLRREAIIGGRLFGLVPERARREFVCLNKDTWLWHEEWVDAHNTWHASTTRYDVRPDGVYKMQDGQPYLPITPQEARHLRAAAQLYHEHVRTALYTS